MDLFAVVLYFSNTSFYLLINLPLITVIPITSIHTSVLINHSSIQATIDRLYLNIPWAYGIRKKSENVVIPDALLSFMENSNGRLRILRSIDYGPATKLLPTLLLPDDELPQNSIIITFDDDRIYTKVRDDKKIQIHVLNHTLVLSTLSR